MHRYQSKRSEVKKLRRESMLERSVSTALAEFFVQFPVLSGLFVTDLAMSKRSGLCKITIASLDPEVNCGKILSILDTLKGQVRTIVSRTLEGAWTPSVLFQFDQKREKVNKVNEIMADKNFVDIEGASSSVDEVIEKLQKNLNNR